MTSNNDSSLTLRTITTESTLFPANQTAQSTSSTPQSVEMEQLKPVDAILNIRAEEQVKLLSSVQKNEDQLVNEKNENETSLTVGAAGVLHTKNGMFSTINSFTINMCLLVMLTNALTVGYRNSVITTIEKCYEFSSIISGILSGALEVGSLIATLIVSYFCAKSHIPKTIALSSLICALGSLMYALPHFLSKSYTMNNKVMNKTISDIMCKAVVLNQPLTVEKNEEIRHNPMLFEHGLKPFGLDPECLIKPSHYGHFVTLILANVLIGVSSAPLYTLGTAYIDNHVSKENASVYLAFIYSMLAFGPLVGYLAGAALLQLYVDTFSISNLKDLKINPSDSNWVGAWYVGFIVFAVLIFFNSFPFFYFPKHLKKEYSQEETGESEVAKVENADVSSKPNENSFGDLKSLPKAIANLLFNRVFMIVTFAYCFEITIISGFMTFLPKYIEHQFMVNESVANIFTGGVAIPGAVIGIVAGGFLVKRFKVDPKLAAVMAMSSNIFSLVGIVILIFIGCSNVTMAGTTISYKSNFKLNDLLHKVQIEPLNLKSECNRDCQCSLNSIEPICGRNGISYFSPCYAGCVRFENNNSNEKNKQTYFSCKCIQEDLTQTNASSLTRPDAHGGLCSSKCEKLVPFLVILFVITFLTALNQMPMLMVTLRSVSEIERAFALGIQLVFMRLLAYIPSPLIFGQAIDWTCLVWRKNECEQVGSCLLYDREKFRYIYGSIAAGYKCVSLVLFALLFFSVRKYSTKQKTLDVASVALRGSVLSLNKVNHSSAANDKDGTILTS